MPKLSPKGASWPVLEGLKLLGRGKVRDSYRLPGGKRLVVATDRISALDFVLDEFIPIKGISLNVATVFWLRYLEQFGIKHHMVACGAGIDEFLTGDAEHLRDDADLQSRAMVVEDLRMLDTEFVYRACLTGSALKPYMETGMVCGHELPVGLQDGDELPQMLFTPTTKAQEGHDVHVTAQEIMAKYPDQAKLGLLILRLAYDYAKAHGIILADTKFEISEDNILADEVLTPDSSRYWPYDAWQAGRKEEKRKAPPSFDKEPIRTWLKAKIAEWCEANKETLAQWVARVQQDNPTIKGFDPEIPECVDVVHGFEMPEAFIRQTTQGYRYIDWRLIGKTIDQYRRDEMGINVPERPPKNVVVIMGSNSDLPVLRTVCDSMQLRTHITGHVMSIHRNTIELVDWLREVRAQEVDVIVAMGSKLLALAGDIDAWLHALNKNIPVAGVALGEPGSRAHQAAMRSMDELPSQPVIMDEIKGEPYSGPDGLRRLIQRIEDGELPPSKPRTKKPVEMNVYFHVNSSSSGK